MRSFNRETDKDSNPPRRLKKNSFIELLRKVVDNNSLVQSQCESLREHNQNGCEIDTEEAKKVQGEDNLVSKAHSRKSSCENLNVRRKSTGSDSSSKPSVPCGLENLGNTVSELLP